MGSQVNLIETSLKGSLHKFINIPMLSLSDETYMDIGAFTVEHLKEVIYKVKGEFTYFKDKPELILSQVDPYNNNIVQITEPFFLNCLSNTLIYNYGGFLMSIGGDTTFENIWLIDRYREFQMSTGDESDTNYGLIAYLRNFNGGFFIGDHIGTKTVKFRNIVGYLNDMTANKYPRWHPRNIELTNPKNNTEIYRQSTLMHGLGSQFFNIRSDDNRIYFFNFRNLDFSNIFARLGAGTPSSMPLIMLTDLND
jgi:hypothetical protein